MPPRTINSWRQKRYCKIQSSKLWDGFSSLRVEEQKRSLFWVKGIRNSERGGDPAMRNLSRRSHAERLQLGERRRQSGGGAPPPSNRASSQPFSTILRSTERPKARNRRPESGAASSTHHWQKGWRAGKERSPPHPPGQTWDPLQRYIVRDNAAHLEPQWVPHSPRRRETRALLLRDSSRGPRQWHRRRKIPATSLNTKREKRRHTEWNFFLDFLDFFRWLRRYWHKQYFRFFPDFFINFVIIFLFLFYCRSPPEWKKKKRKENIRYKKLRKNCKNYQYKRRSCHVRRSALG